jgi:hypothetical protein
LFAQDLLGNDAGKNAGQQNAREQGADPMIAHALSMAIQSSNMMLAAQQRNYTPAHAPAPDALTPSAVRSGAVDPIARNGPGHSVTANNRAGGATNAPTSPPNAGTGNTDGTVAPGSGSRSTGLAGQEEYDPRAPTPRTSAAGARLGNRGDAVTARRGASDQLGTGTGRVGQVAEQTGFASTQLLQHAKRGFEDSERLFQLAGRNQDPASNSPQAFLNAARQYARTLEALATTGSGTDSPATGGHAGAPDVKTVYLVNHAVMEALDAHQLRNTALMANGRLQGSDVLIDHARQMQAEGKQLIQALALPYQPAGLGTKRYQGDAESRITAGTSGTPPRGVSERTGARPANGAKTGDSLLDAATAGAEKKAGTSSDSSAKTETRPLGTRPVGDLPEGTRQPAEKPDRAAAVTERARQAGENNVISGPRQALGQSTSSIETLVLQANELIQVLERMNTQ